MDANGVPLLDVSQETVDLMGEPRPDLEGAAPASDDLLLGSVVVVDNPRPVGSERADTTTFWIGAETLNEAAKSVAGAIVVHARRPPEWVASDNEQLAAILA